MPLLKRRPSFAMAISSGLAFILLVGLGIWQVERLFWKENLIASREGRAHLSPISVPLTDQTSDDMAFRAAVASGNFENDHEMYLMARTLRGNIGFQVITPLRQGDGKVILVNRGWVPDDKKAPSSRPQSLIDGPVTVHGVLRVAGPKHWMQPENEPEKNQWFYVDMDAMAKASGQKLASRYYLELDDEPIPGGLPIGGQAKVNLPNNHLQYAATWFSLAGALLIMFIIYHRSPVPEQKKST